MKKMINIFLFCCLLGQIGFSQDDKNCNFKLMEFYKNLLNETPPTTEDEKIFGKDGCGIRQLILDHEKEIDKTIPIYSYLRLHKDWFIPKHSSPETVMRSISVSQPFKMMKLSTGKLQSDDWRICTIFLEKQVASNSYGGDLKIVIFTITSDGTIDIDNTIIDNKLLYSLVYGSIISASSVNK